MFKKTLTSHIQGLANKYPVVTLLGPRQSGKTTLVQAAFPSMPYVNMELAENRALATIDPRSFIELYPEGAILDEVQRTSHLLSYIQVLVDQLDRKGMFTEILQNKKSIYYFKKKVALLLLKLKVAKHFLPLI